jgi:hypothetical protein
MEKRNNLDKWLIKPGTHVEREGIAALVEQLITDYADQTEAPRNLCLNDSDEAIYFISFPDEEASMDGADVAIYNAKENKFVFVPKDLAFNLAQSYITHIKYLGEAYEFLDLERQ